MQTTAPRVVTIYTEANPNPNSLKFVANSMLMPEGVSKDFPDVTSTEDAPLAKALFDQFSYVKRVFYMSNFVTITKEEQAEWFEIKNELQQFIKSWLESEKPLLTGKVEEPVEEEVPGDDVESQIKKVLDEYIRPAVEMDGGAISFQSFNDGVVSVLLQGSCSGCPSSMITLKSGIENLLRRMVPEVQTVMAEEG